MTTYYSGTVIGAVVTLGLLRRVNTMRSGGAGRHVMGATLATAGVVAFCTMTNPLYALWFVLPAGAVLLVLRVCSQLSSRALCRAGLVLCVGTALGMALRIPFAHSIVATTEDYWHLRDIGASLAYHARQVSDTLATRAGIASLCITLGMWIASIVIALAVVRRGKVVHSFIALSACLGPFIVAVAVIVMGSEATRYLQPWAFLPFLALTVLPGVEFAARGISRRILAWLPARESIGTLRAAGVVGAAIFLGVVCALTMPRINATVSVVDADLRCVTDWVDASGRTGAGLFWTMRAPKAYAADPRQIVQVDDQLHAGSWLANRHDAVNAQVTFFITDADSYPFSFSDASPAGTMDVISCGRYAIHDFYPVVAPLKPAER